MLFRHRNYVFDTIESEEAPDLYCLILSLMNFLPASLIIYEFGICQLQRATEQGSTLHFFFLGNMTKKSVK